MSVRSAAAELAALAAVTLWVYAGSALVVAQLGDGASLSFTAVAAVVVLSYGLVRLLQRLDASDAALRTWGTGLSVALFYLILRLEVAGDAQLWELGWLIDIVADFEATLEGRAGDVTAVVLLSAAWLRGVQRGARPPAFEGLLAEVSVGIGVVLMAAAFASSADAPTGLRWLPVPYVAAGFLALALAHLRTVAARGQEPFLGVWALWTGGSLALIGGIATLAALFEPPSFQALSEGLALAGKGVGYGLFLILTPFIVAIGWTLQHVFDWLATGDAFIPEEPDPVELTTQVDDEERDSSEWSKVFGYITRSSLVVLVLALAVAVLWLAFRRQKRRRADDEDLRERIEPETVAIPGVPSILAGALGRLRGLRGRSRSRDAIGRLYTSVLRRAEAQGLARPPAATPLEFAPRLQEHFGSSVLLAISRAYATTRYAGRPPPADELERLRARWDEVARGSA